MKNLSRPTLIGICDLVAMGSVFSVCYWRHDVGLLMIGMTAGGLLMEVMTRESPTVGRDDRSDI